MVMHTGLSQGILHLCSKGPVCQKISQNGKEQNAL